MPLTREQIAKYEKIIADTGSHREAFFKDRIIPDSYRAHSERVERSEVRVPGPAAALPVLCRISAAKDREPGCLVHINVHGGGFYFGHTEDDDLYCAHLADALSGIVVDVDYALCPEHPFPAAFEQCYEVARWTFAHCAEWGANPERVSMGGQSAGGNLTAAVALKSTFTGDFRLCLQELGYAALDSTMNQARFAPGDPLAARSEAFGMMYAGGDPSLLSDPLVSPALAPDSMLKGLPPALITSGGKCPFHDSNEAYGLRLAALGVEVTMKRFTESRHGFTVRMMDEWREAQEFVIRGIGKTGAIRARGRP